MRKLITSVAIATGLALVCASPVAFAKEEENVSTSEIPAAVQKTAEQEATGGKLVRWEKHSKNYEAIIDKDGKLWGVVINPSGKVLNKHDEGKEKENEKAEKH